MRGFFCPRSREVEPLEVSKIFSHFGISENCLTKCSAVGAWLLAVFELPGG